MKFKDTKKMTDTTDEMSTLPPVETAQPNTSNESSHNCIQPVHLQINHHLK